MARPRNRHGKINLTVEQQATVASYFNLAMWLAIERSRRFPGIDSDCLKSTASEGLCYAVFTFDESRGIPINVYITMVIKHFLTRDVQKAVINSQRVPTVPFSHLSTDGEGFDVPSRYAPDLNMRFDVVEIREELKRILTPRLYNCFMRLYVDGLTLQEIGDIYGLSRERIRQLVGESHRRIAVHSKNFERFRTSHET